MRGSMQNHLKDQTSPYLLQHAENPVDWYPWCGEAFVRAKQEDKPVFLSIGYSTCHWCHVMAHESFEDEQVAEILNRYFICVKVDKEERPDIDSIYMSVCQAFTGSGGWPTTVFLSPDQKPFFAGTYFPKTAGYGQIGLIELLLMIHEKWETNREVLLRSADEIISFLNGKNREEISVADAAQGKAGDVQLTDRAFAHYRRIFDEEYGGFGDAPKFPAPHNLLFLMRYFEKSGNENAMAMVEKTLRQMYRGGIFDHIGGGFCRYSTDRFFLAPHFEKMLYDNALLILALCKAYQMSKNDAYRDVAEKTAGYVLREMTSPEGGFYSAQDADSEGEEGKFYLFEPVEIVEVLGEEKGKAFNRYFDITSEGNFEGKNIPNLLQNSCLDGRVDDCLSAVYEYRRKRYALHLDDKILTGWNGLMIAAMCWLYRVTGKEIYLKTAMKAQDFIQKELCRKDILHVSYRKGQCSNRGFLDDYAFEIYALLALYEASLEKAYLERAQAFCRKAITDFYDEEKGGFFLCGKENEKLILRPKETYDGEVFSGNSAMAYNLVRLYWMTGEKQYEELAQKQIAFMSLEAGEYPAGHAMFLMALMDFTELPEKITVVLKDGRKPADISSRIPLGTVVSVLEGPTEEYPLKDDKTTYYVCRGRACLPPVNEI